MARALQVNVWMKEADLGLAELDLTSVLLKYFRFVISCNGIKLGQEQGSFTLMINSFG